MMSFKKSLVFIFIFILSFSFVSASSGYITKTGVFFILEGLSYNGLGQNTSNIVPGDSVELYTEWVSSSTLGWAVLSTNETGNWKNYTDGTYGSPLDLSGYNSWSNFTWSNSSITNSGISWKIYANDTYNRSEATNTTTFMVSTTSTTTSTTTTISGGGGGGGGGETTTTVSPDEINFTVSPDLIKVNVKQGETGVRYIEIRNIGEGEIDINAIKTGFESELLLEKENFKIPEGGLERFKLIFSPNSDMEPGIYIGKVYFKVYEITKSVDVIMEVEEKSPLFDIEVNIPEIFGKIRAGNKVFASIELTNMGEERLLDVTLYYSIIDTENNIITQKVETFAVDKSKTINREIEVPEGSEPGKYLVYARVEYEDKVATSSEFFEVIGEEDTSMILQLIIVAVLLVSLLIILRVVSEVEFRIKHKSVVKWSPEKRTNMENAKKILSKFPNRIILDYKRIKSKHKYFTKIVTKKKRKNKERH